MGWNTAAESHPRFGARVQMRPFAEKHDKRNKKALRFSVQIVGQSALHEFAMPVFAVQVRKTGVRYSPTDSAACTLMT